MSKDILISKELNCLCSGYLRKETAVLSIALPLVFYGLGHYAVYLKNAHRKKEEILRCEVNER